MRVSIEHPYFTQPSGERCTVIQISVNHEYMVRCIRDSLGRGEQPYLSIPIFALTGALDDHDPEQRRQGIGAGLAWADAAEITAVYCDRGLSSGMQDGIDRALAVGRPVEMRRIGK